MTLKHDVDISGLSQDELSEVLQHALRIEAQHVATAEKSHDLESFLQAAEEVGIQRDTVIQALREKLGYPLEDLEPGMRVFAKSADGAFYVAIVQEVRGGMAKVRFLSGSDYDVPLTDLRRFVILPGQQLQVKWPGWGWWSSEVVRFEPQSGVLTASDGWSQKNFALTDVRLPAQRTPRQQAMRVLFWKVGLAAAGAGAIAGALLMKLFS